MEIRPEIPDDVAAIARLIAAAFALTDYGDGSEPAIVERLRAAGALSLSLVAVEDGEIVGHVALSPVSINTAPAAWLGVGPLAVRPDRQRQGVGTALMRAALAWARSTDAEGCVVLGDPAYYGRFGFIADGRLLYPGPPREHFLTLSFGDAIRAGEVAYHEAFSG